MDIIWDYFKDFDGRSSSYGIAALLILVWWVGRSFARLFQQEASGPDRLAQSDDQQRPRRRLPLQ